MVSGNDQKEKSLHSVTVDERFRQVFFNAQDYVNKYFRNRLEDPTKGIIEISGERYVLIRAAAMSVEIFELIETLYKDRGDENARAMARDFLFDISHSLGKSDAKKFHSKMNFIDPIERLSAGPVHFAYSGWAVVDLLPESNITPDENYLLIFDHHSSFEADAWIKNKKITDFPVCIMNAGYSSGWCEESFRIPLVAVEIECQARGDKRCRFIMAPPSKIEQYISHYTGKTQEKGNKATAFAVPEFFHRKKLEDALNEVHNDLEKQIEERTMELQRTNESLKREIEQRQQSQKIFEKVFNASPFGFYIIQGKKFQFVNPEFQRITGYSDRELLNMESLTLVHPEDRDMVRGKAIQMLKGHCVKPFEFRAVTKSGEMNWISQKIVPIEHDGKPAAFGYYMDVTEQKLTEEALKKSEEKFKILYEESKRAEEIYRSLLNSSADAVVTYDLEGRANYVNPSFTEMFGWTLKEVKDGRIPFVPKSEMKATMATIKSVVEEGRPCHGFETKRFTKNGDLIDISISASLYKDHKGKPSGMLVILRDISDSKRLQAQLHQAQKMEAIGTLAGGIAHDFNNILMAVQGNVSLMLIQTEAESSQYDRLRNIERQVEMGSKLTSQLLGYARKGRYEVKPIDMNKLIEIIIETFGRTRKEVIIHKDLADDLSLVEVDEGQVEQVLLNLFINASDAMAGGGTLTVKTMNVKSKDMGERQYKPNRGNYVLLSITDTGTGMDRETMEKIFDPFFTTKEMGRGTGLGLASVFGIIKGHGGYIDVESMPGHGSTFMVYLPASKKATIDSVTKIEKAVKGFGEILLVDDEEAVLFVGQEMLEALGYKVLTAKSGQEAVETIKEKKGQISLVILDMIMPGMGGGETRDILRQIDKDISIILSSGYSLEGKAAEIIKKGCNGFLQKPFKLHQLSESIKDALEKPSNLCEC
jgi:two-component system, cell cycle sensor histidine kinase and response regulator CckA